MKSIIKQIIILIVFALFSTLLFSADNKQKIGESGDKAWADLIAKFISAFAAFFFGRLPPFRMRGNPEAG